MKQQIFYDNFLAALEERYPLKADLVNALTDILVLEKESIYRRLRRDVFFSADEVMRIASAWNLSLDNIICANPEKIRPFQYEMVDYNNPVEADYALLERFNNDMALVAKDPNGKVYEVLNSFPRGMYSRSELLTRFMTMKWLYKYGNPGEVRKFCDIKISERMQEIDREHINKLHNIAELHSYLDKRIYANVVDEIAYFHYIGMISKEEKAALKSDLLELIDYSELISQKGIFAKRARRFFSTCRTCGSTWNTRSTNPNTST